MAPRRPPEAPEPEAAPPPDPIDVVERELTRPDGTKVRVRVPVYPPFRLEDRGRAPAPRPGRQRGAPMKRRKAGS